MALRITQRGIYCGMDIPFDGGERIELTLAYHPESIAEPLQDFMLIGQQVDGGAELPPVFRQTVELRQAF